MSAHTHTDNHDQNHMNPNLQHKVAEMTEAPALFTDRFVDFLQGPAVQVTVGSAAVATLPHLYILPCKLLSTHSVSFRRAINQGMTEFMKAHQEATSLVNNNGGNQDGADGSKPTAKRIELRPISLANVEPSIFGLFLRFIYQGGYPSDMAFSAPFGPGSTGPKDIMSSVPVHFRAWVLGEDLCAHKFQNHAIEHIYCGAGTRYSLTPSLVYWVWDSTNRFVGMDRNGKALPNSNADENRECKLRTLVLHLLVAHWAAPNNIVSRFPGLESHWANLFTAQQSLRDEFIFGLRTLKVLPMESYLVESNAGNVLDSTQATKDSLGRGGSQSAAAATAATTASKAKTSPTIVIKPEASTPDMDKLSLVTPARKSPPTPTKKPPQSGVFTSPTLSTSFQDRKQPQSQSQSSSTASRNLRKRPTPLSSVVDSTSSQRSEKQIKLDGRFRCAGDKKDDSERDSNANNRSHTTK
ncbi:unnamed protein product [Periconia digitata]|uniref:Uncharacterized protein n=1 Tax=Periconia digitata TaxID=1303443 RepID=A0A9W4UQ38_9PLEO|nr:unnamed protein product [Periconia digitata]